jgi:hypothetical protein
VLFYYPYENGRETRPIPGDKQLARRAGKRAASKSVTAGAASTAATASASATATASASKRNGRKTSKGDRSSSSSSSSTGASAGAGGAGKRSSKGPIALDDDDDGKEEDEDDGVAGGEGEGVVSAAGDIDNDDYIYEIVDDEEDASAADRKIFQTVSVFWQDRLVPSSALQKLPFFPDARTKLQCDTDKLPENWRGRLKGYLFFDWNFRHISNNKLRIQVDPNIDDWLNDKSIAKQIILTPNSLKQQFIK